MPGAGRVRSPSAAGRRPAGRPPGGRRPVRPRAPLFGPYTLGLLGLCGSWPAPENALGGVKANGAPPILVLGAVDDPVAPYEAVRALSGQLSSATLVSWQSGRHGSYPASACVTAAVDGYLLQGRMPAVGTLCQP